MHGFEEQSVAITPAHGVVLVRMGATKEVVLRWEKAEFYRGVYATVDTLRDEMRRPVGGEGGRGTVDLSPPSL